MKLLIPIQKVKKSWLPMKHMWPKTKQRLKLQRRWLKLKGKLLMLLSNKSTVKLFRAMLLSNNSTVKLCRALLF